VRIIDNITPPIHNGDWPKYLKKEYELMEGDVTSKEDMRKALDGVDFVLHLAAHQDQLPNFSKFFSVNTVSTSLIYEILNEYKMGVRKVVVASTQFIYGDGVYRSDRYGEFMPELRSLEQLKERKWDVLDKDGGRAQFEPFKEEQKPNPTNSYGLSKFASESLAIRLGKTLGVPTAVARYSIVQGPRQSPYNPYSGALRIFVIQALTGSDITVFEDGRQLRDFVNVGDVARANKLLLESERSDFEVFNVGGGRGYPLIEFAECVKKVTGSDSKIVVNGQFRRTDTRNAVSDIAKISGLGWKPTLGIEQSIRDYADWVRKEGIDLASLASKAKKSVEESGVVEIVN
jgi:dTDP-L-rhamnose 4-epimerase